MKMKHNARRRLSAVLLSLALVFTCLPFMTEKANAETTLPQPDYDGVFSVYDTWFNYYPFGTYGRNNPYFFTSFYSPKVYMEYSADGVNWSRTGYMQCESVSGPLAARYRIGGLRPGTVYKTRIYYGDKYGNPVSPYRTTTTIKTGKKKKPAVKSVSSKAVNVRFHRTYRSGYYYWTGYHYVWIKGGIMEYYTYNVKVTVRLKKKPGTKGIYVNDRWLKGNKKKYTTTFRIASPYNISVKRPRGNIKYTVQVQSGQSGSWGGYSPAWKKTMRLK